MKSPDYIAIRQGSGTQRKNPLMEMFNPGRKTSQNIESHQNQERISSGDTISNISARQSEDYPRINQSFTPGTNV